MTDPIDPEVQAARASAVVAALKKRADLHWQPGAAACPYALAILPNDDPTWAQAYAKTAWSCGLDGLAVLHEVGIDAPEVDYPYAQHIGAVMGLLAAVGKRFGALDVTQPIAPPDPGDFVLLDHVGGHLSGVVEVTQIDATSWDVLAVDGGQVFRDGSRAVLARHRVYHLTNGVLTASDADGPHSPHNLGTPCKVLWILRSGRLPVRLAGDDSPPNT